MAAAFDPQAAALLSEPAKVQPDQYALFCKVAVARLNAITSLPAHEAGDLMSSLFRRQGTGRAVESIPSPFIWGGVVGIRDGGVIGPITNATHDPSVANAFSNSVRK